MADADTTPGRPPERPTKQASEEELAVAFGGPALLANKFFISITGSGVRLAFAEQNGNLVPPQFRTAVVLPFEDAYALVDLVSRLLKENVQFIPAPEMPKADGV